MKTDQIIFEDNRLELLVSRPSHFVTIFILSAVAFCIIVPLIILIDLLIDSAKGFSIRLLTLVLLSIPFLFGLYLIRLFLWNFYGREIYDLQEGKLRFLTDYKYFKDSHKEIKFKNKGFGFEQSGYENEKKAVLIIETMDRRHKSAVELPENELKKLTELLNQNFKK